MWVFGAIWRVRPVKGQEGVLASKPFIGTVLPMSGLDAQDIEGSGVAECGERSILGPVDAVSIFFMQYMCDDQRLCYPIIS